MVSVLAIDVGTSAIKVLVSGATGKIHALTSAQIKTRTLPGGGMEQDPESIWQAVQSAASKAIAQAGRPIDAVALANPGESVLAFDPSTGTPHTPIVTWQDQRAAGICRELAGYGEQLAKATGLRLDAYFTAPKLAWLRAEVTRKGVVGTLDSWLLHKLTGQFVTDAATASRSLLVDLDSGRWNRQLTEVFGLEHEVLPTIVANDAVIGTTSAFGSEVPVAGAVLDQPSALLAQRCLDAGSMKITFGTGVFLLQNAGTQPPSNEALTCSTAWEVRGRRTFCLDAQAYVAGSAIQWLVELGLITDPRALDQGCDRDGPGRLIFVPDFHTPAGALLTGLTLDTTGPEIVAAVVHGIAAQVADMVDQAGSAGLPLHADGGLTHSRAMMQAVADLTQVPVHLYPGAHATAQGAAALARLALSPDGEIAQYIPPAPVKPAICAPKMDPATAADYRARWRDAAADAATVAQRHSITALPLLQPAARRANG